MTDDDCRYRKNNYDLCMAVDQLKLGIVLDRMVAEGSMHPAMAKTFNLQASSLLAALRNANNQAFGKAPQTPIR